MKRIILFAAMLRAAPVWAQVAPVRLPGLIGIAVAPAVSHPVLFSLVPGALTPAPAPSISMPAAFAAPAALSAAVPAAAAQAPAAAALAATPQAAASSPAEPAAASAARAAAPSSLPAEFWDGAITREEARALPYWRDAFEENARVLAGARSRAVRGLVSVSYFATRDSAGVPVPGLQLVLASGAEPAAVVGRLIAAHPELKDYRVMSAVTPGSGPVLYLARPTRSASESHPKERAARAADQMEDASYWDTMNAVTGHTMGAGRVERLRKDYIERPDVFDSRREALRYIVLGEEPAAARKTDETLARFLSEALTATTARRLWHGKWGKRAFTAVLSRETPARLPQTLSIQGAKLALKDYSVSQARLSASTRRRREILPWAGNIAAMLVIGTISFAGAPALAWFARDVLEKSPFMILNPLFVLGVPIILITLLKAGYDAARWTWRMARLYFSIAAR
ncbi:MAG: hypothetical protein ACHQ49_08835 [Elusimicrobiota bacterium]